jgi:hypothetical protein
MLVPLSVLLRPYLLSVFVVRDIGEPSLPVNAPVASIESNKATNGYTRRAHAPPKKCQFPSWGRRMACKPLFMTGPYGNPFNINGLQRLIARVR